MKKKLMTFLCCAMLMICGGGILLLSTGCGNRDYDLSKITFDDAIVDYNGSAQFTSLKGELPKGLEVSYKYYTDEAYEFEAVNTIDAGVYYVQASFVAGKGYNTPQPMTAKFTINKIDYTDVQFNVTASNAEFENPVAAKKNSDGSYYFEANNNVYEKIAVANNKNANSSIKFFLDEELTTEAPAALRNFGQKVYVQATLLDKNHNDYVETFVIVMERKTVEIRNFQDLQMMYKHVHGQEALDMNARNNIRYMLMNDIDCKDEQGQPSLWMSIGGVYGDEYFCSEFDGNGYTISNLKYTIESIEKIDSELANDGVHVSFFGNAYGADIHDVNFSDINITVNAGDYARVDHELWGAQNPLYASVVVGRMEQSPENGQISRLENITVKNCNIKVDAFKMFVGGIVATDQIASETAVRKNLNVENCNIYAISTEYMDSMVVGGICAAQRREGNGTFVYSDCSVKNTKIGFDYESWNKATGIDKNKYVSVWIEPTVGGFLGSVGTKSTFENCQLENYLIATNKKTGFYGSLSTTVEFDNCTHEQKDANWNEFTGVYGKNGKVDETELNWKSATYTPSTSTRTTLVETNKTQYYVGEKIAMHITVSQEEIPDYYVQNTPEDIALHGKWWMAIYKKGDKERNQDSYLCYSYLFNFEVREDLAESYYTGKNLLGKTYFFPLEESGMVWCNPYTGAPESLDEGEYELVLINGYASANVYNFEMSCDFSVVA